MCHVIRIIKKSPELMAMLKVMVANSGKVEVKVR
jgi:hypothetical protein